MNTYATAYDVMVAMSIAPDAQGDEPARERILMLSEIDWISRQIEEFTHRKFWTAQAVRYFSTGPDTLRLRFTGSDLLSVTTFETDSKADGTWTGQSWVEDTDFWLWPYDDDKWPKTEARVPVIGIGNYVFPQNRDRYVKINGLWGYGDGNSADPWAPELGTDGVAVTASFASATTKSGALSAAGSIEAGNTLLVEDEQVFVTSRTGTAIVCDRGVNRTTAAIHSAKPVSVALYPQSIVHLAMNLAIGWWNKRRAMGFESEDIDGHRYTYMRSQRMMMKNVAGRFVSPIVA